MEVSVLPSSGSSDTPSGRGPSPRSSRGEELDNPKFLFSLFTVETFSAPEWVETWGNTGTRNGSAGRGLGCEVGPGRERITEWVGTFPDLPYTLPEAPVGTQPVTVQSPLVLGSDRNSPVTSTGGRPFGHGTVRPRTYEIPGLLPSSYVSPLSDHDERAHGPDSRPPT